MLFRSFKKIYKERDENVQLEQSIKTEIDRIEAHREKYMNMYTDDLITREQLNEKIGGTKERLQELQKELKRAKLHITKYDQLDSILQKTFCDIEKLITLKEMTNGQLRKIIDGIEVDHEGNVDIHLKLYDRIGLSENVLIVDEATYRHDGAACGDCSSFVGKVKGGFVLNLRRWRHLRDVAKISMKVENANRE